MGCGISAAGAGNADMDRGGVALTVAIIVATMAMQRVNSSSYLGGNGGCS